MAEQNTSIESQEPFIPPQYLLILAAIGLVVALVVWITQPEFGVVGYGGLGFAVLSLLAWVLIAPQQAKAAFTGRTARFGGLSLFITVLLLVALVFVYILGRTLSREYDLRLDVSERDTFSLTEASEIAIQGIANDPTRPNVRLIAFYNASQAARRDQDVLLLEDYVQTSGEKISYEFVDPDRSPQIAQQYEAQSGDIAVVPVNADGTLDVANAQVVSSLSQDDLTSAILRVTAAGVFNVYVMGVENGVGMTPSDRGSIQILMSELTNQLDWNVQETNFLELSRNESPIELNDSGADSEVMVIVGGSQPLAESELQTLTNYLNNGGNLIIFADTLLNQDRESLATGETLSQYLWDTFGLRFQPTVVIDIQDYVQSELNVLVSDFDPTSPITQAAPPGSVAILEAATSIELAETPPENVIVTPILRTGPMSYAKTDVDALVNGAVEQTEADIAGPLVVAATAENTQTGARVVLFGSTSPIQDNYVELQGRVANITLALESFLWVTDFRNFAVQNVVFSDPTAQDTPIFVEAGALRTINLITMVLLPFGILGLGIYVWWSNRERERVSR